MSAQKRPGQAMSRARIERAKENLERMIRNQERPRAIYLTTAELKRLGYALHEWGNVEGEYYSDEALDDAIQQKMHKELKRRGEE